MKSQVYDKRTLPSVGDILDVSGLFNRAGLSRFYRAVVWKVSDRTIYYRVDGYHYSSGSVNDDDTHMINWNTGVDAYDFRILKLDYDPKQQGDTEDDI